MKIIIYGSKYGTTKQYAEELSKRTNIKAEEYTNIQNVNNYETIIYIGALYAGGVLGMKKTLNKLSNTTNKKIIIITVGLADPKDKNNTDSIREGIKRQISQDIYNQAGIYFLRGGIDYSALNLKHKTMMALLYRKAKGLKEEEKTAEVKVMIETYGKKVNFINFESLNPIIDAI
jgi:menaquinone-dependent protoporphyrinogen IX oxidase